MFHSLFDATTIPITEQVINFTEARQNVLAGNIANMDTPGYKVRDLSVEAFQQQLQQAIQSQHDAPVYRSPGEPAAEPSVPLAEVAKNAQTILHHDKSNVGMEHQVTEMVKNQIQHNMAIAIMTSQFRLLQAAISERA